MIASAVVSIFALLSHYNPLAYIRSEKDILKLVNTIIANTKGEGNQSGEDFWVKAERLYYSALIGYIWYEAPDDEKNLNTLIEMINASETREDDESFENPIDKLFKELEQENPEHFAVRQYKKYKLAAGKTAKSILISCGARLAPFDIAELRELTEDDELELDTLGEENAETTIVQDSEAPTLGLPEGNATIIEDVSADVVERQFIAIQSKNGNTFYIVIDKDSKDKENVYFMNLVDEYDMLAFAEDFPEGVTVETPDGEQVEPVTDADGNVIENPDDTSEGEKEDKTEKTENEGGGNNTLLILVGVFALAGGGAFYYFKVYKTKPKAPKQSITNPKKKEKFYDKHYGEITLFKTAKTFYDNKLSGPKLLRKRGRKNWTN